MKTKEQFYTEIAGSAELMEALKKAVADNKLGDFLKEHDCGADVKEFAEYLISETEGEIADDSAEAAAGGVRACSKEEMAEYFRIIDAIKAEHMRELEKHQLTEQEKRSFWFG